MLLPCRSALVFVFSAEEGQKNMKGIETVNATSKYEKGTRRRSCNLPHSSFYFFLSSSSSSSSVREITDVLRFNFFQDTTVSSSLFLQQLLFYNYYLSPTWFVTVVFIIIYRVRQQPKESFRRGRQGEWDSLTILFIPKADSFVCFLSCLLYFNSSSTTKEFSSKIRTRSGRQSCSCGC